MKVFGTDLDGCVADTASVIDYEFRKEFKVHNVVNEEAYYSWEKYGVDEEVGAPFVRSLLDGLVLWRDSKPIHKNIAEISRWTMTGMVPSVITGRNISDRIITEFWMAQHNVGYSNLVMGVKDDMKGLFAKHLDCSFFIEDLPAAAFNVAEYGVKVYVIRQPYNRWMERKKEIGSDPSRMLDWDLITFVDDYTQIAELEKIK